MVTPELLSFAAIALLLTISPGPDTFLVMGNTLGGGVRRGLATVAGITCGGAVHATVAAFGLAQILVYSAKAFFVMKTLGALYLLWLGITGLRSALKPAAATTELTAAAPAALGRSWLQGMLTNVLNPKVAVFYLAFLPQFLHPGDPIAAKSALLVGIHYTIGLVWLSLVSVAVARLTPWLKKSGVRRTLDGVVATVMLGFGAKLALARG